MEQYEKVYWKLRKEMTEAEACEEWDKYMDLKNQYLSICRVITDKIMEENSDVLKRLKEC